MKSKDKPMMRTISVLAFGERKWEKSEHPEHFARIEKAKVLYTDRNETTEVLKFCYIKGGRHARTHLTIQQKDFGELFENAVEKNVFDSELEKKMYKVLEQKSQRQTAGFKEQF